MCFIEGLRINPQTYREGGGVWGLDATPTKAFSKFLKYN